MCEETEIVDVSTSVVEFSNGAWSLCSSDLVPQPVAKRLLLHHAVNFWSCCLTKDREVRENCL